VNPPTRVLTGPVALLCLVVLTACSGDRSPSRPHYRRQVEQVCRELRRDSAALPTPEATDTAALVRVGRRAVALERAALGRIQSLDAPAADERAVGRWLELVDRAIDASTASLAALAAGDLPASRAANERGRVATTRADAIARDLGVDDCATPASG
jgi:hypothetical protein